MILFEFASTGIEETFVFQALSAGNGMNPFKSAPRPVSMPSHVPLCARLSLERHEKTLMTAAINKTNAATLRSRAQTNALIGFIATKIRITARSTVFIAKHSSLSSILLRRGKGSIQAVPRRAMMPLRLDAVHMQSLFHNLVMICTLPAPPNSINTQRMIIDRSRARYFDHVGRADLATNSRKLCWQRADPD
jgi:hypothetical protein